MRQNNTTTGKVISSFQSLPALGGATLTAAGQLAYWRTSGDRTELRLFEIESQSVKTLPVNAVEPHGWEFLADVADGIVINSRPETYLVTWDGEVSEFLPESEYTQIHDVDSSAHRVLYLHYGEPWTLRIYDHRTGERNVVSEFPEQHHHAGFSRQGDYIAYRRNRADDFGAGSLVVGTPAGEIVWEGHAGAADTTTLLHDWQPNGSKLLISDRTTDTFRVGVFDWLTSDSVWLTDSDWPAYGMRFTPNGDQVLAVRHSNGADIPLVIDIQSGEIRELDLPEGVINRSKFTTIRRFLDDDRFFLEHQSGSHPPRLLIYDLRTDEKTILVETGEAITDDISPVEAEYVWYDSSDGWEIGAVLYDSGLRPSPAVIHVHGGPTTSANRDFDPFAQVLANCGYTVLQPNYRGSTNHGRAFQEAIRGDLGGGEVEDIANGARWLAAQDWIDGDRIAVYGHSHGALNAGLQSIRFPQLYGVVFISNGYLAFEDGPDDTNRYARRYLIEEAGESVQRERNIVRRADEISCPICIIWGEEDHGLDAVEQLVNRLTERGWQEGEEYRLETFEGEGHEIQAKNKLWSLIIEELERRL
jgi:dipeptidyl aminopeptidase/acylaminoacyl peptidase